MTTTSPRNGSLLPRAVSTRHGFPFAMVLPALLVLTACEQRSSPSGSYSVVASRGTRSELLPEVQQPRVNPGSSNAGAAQGRNGRAMKFSWTDPAGFTAQAPPASMGSFVDDFYVAAKQGEESHDTLFTSFYMSVGTIEANVSRWAGQFVDPNVTRQERIRIGAGIEAYVFEVEGAGYGSASRLWGNDGPKPVRAIFLALEHPGGGILSLRFIGPPSGVERLQAAFWKTVETLRATG